MLSTSLTRFDGIHANSVNKLYWETTSETNHSHFDLEKSTDGTNFKKLTAFSGTGNTTTLRKYGYTDGLTHDDQFNRFYYRLKSFDLDGSFKFSNIVVLERNPKQEITIYPNPVTRGDLIQLNLNGIEGTKLELVNELGQITFSQTGSITGNISFRSGTNWSAGMYILKITTETSTITQKIFIR